MIQTQHRVEWDGFRQPLGGCWLRDYFKSPWGFEETVARLVALSGQPATSSDQYKTSVEFRGAFDGEYFALYDYKSDREIHIGGTNALDVAGLQAALATALATVRPMPYQAQEFYDDASPGHQWPLAPARVFDLFDVVSRAKSVIEESDGADEHRSLIEELAAAMRHLQAVRS
jgi:hypothetical protein